MNRNAALIATIWLTSSPGLVLTPGSAVGMQRAVFVGRVTSAFPASRDAWGTAQAWAVEPNSACVHVAFYVLEMDWRWRWTLVEVDSVSVEPESIEIVGYWDVHLNNERYPRQHYELHVWIDGWGMWQVDDPAESEFGGYTLLYKS